MRERRPTVDITFDGVEFEAYADETILQAARRLGVDIPSLCYLEGVSIHGGCRLCVVQVAEDHKLQPACATQVRP
jgi:NADH dehydrogenase/NADH:ubiquinone oxidoreductase subunit G